MATLHIESTVRDFAQWKAAFDKFEQFRADHGVQSYRVSRLVGDSNRLTVDLDFESVDAARAFGGHLAKIWSTPQSQAQMISHGEPLLLDVVEQRQLAS
jgi:hypothetical protein